MRLSSLGGVKVVARTLFGPPGEATCTGGGRRGGRRGREKGGERRRGRRNM